MNQKNHISEESICWPLIGKQSYKPYFLYCTEDRYVKFLSLKRMQNHVRLKDPQKHKAKLLEILD